ncbi:HNH endonuclease [Tateyamaria omphalii]|uniref:HNH endonuclease n=1 Tax=Tateyamaria omphalii TaxID=299262 RepID=UPI001C98F744|nr:HNH endonuclease [Tateyamaria omphalii]MBY5931572.1 HNH endonuclease [Tateyamaria omphalii]
MAFGVFMHRSDSIYDDVPAVQYQFPKQYLGRARQCEGNWIVYLEPSKVRNTRGYFAVARVAEIVADPKNSDMFLALIEPNTYLDFGDPVPYRDFDGYVEQGVLNSHGRLSGRAQAAVRTLDPRDFHRIIQRGLGTDTPILPRTDTSYVSDGMNDAAALFEHLGERRTVEQRLTRAVRDRNFRKVVLSAYAETCAITGLRLINGGGRAEAEAAHIKPVAASGPDIVTNGIALSGTVHWMFDRGLIGLSGNLDILISRQANDQDAIGKLINPTGTLLQPRHKAYAPHPAFTSWHREHVFKK